MSSHYEFERYSLEAVSTTGVDWHLELVFAERRRRVRIVRKMACKEIQRGYEARSRLRSGRRTGKATKAVAGNIGFFKSVRTECDKLLKSLEVVEVETWKKLGKT